MKIILSNSMQCPVCQSKSKKKTLGAYFLCITCQSLFVKEIPTSILRKNRVETDAVIMLESKNDEKEINSNRLMRLGKYITKKSTILDVGCGYGAFLLNAKESGYEPFAMDVSKKLLPHLEQKGIKGFTKMDQIKKNSMDVITTFDVIEHTTNPQLFIEQIKNVLKKNGIIMITTPNMTGISGRVLRDKWWVFGPDGHYSLFSPKSLKLLLNKNGFETISTRTDSFTLWINPSNTFFKKVINKILYITFSIFQTYAYDHLLGDNLEIIARKKN